MVSATVSPSESFVNKAKAKQATARRVGFGLWEKQKQGRTTQKKEKTSRAYHSTGLAHRDAHGKEY
jgi:hypothetical protein